MTIQEWEALKPQLRAARSTFVCSLTEECKLTVQRVAENRSVLTAWIGDDPFPVQPTDLLRRPWAAVVLEKLVKEENQALKGLMRMAYASWTKLDRERLSKS